MGSVVLGFTRSGFVVSSDLFLDSQDLSSWSLMDLFLDSRDLFYLITGYNIAENVQLQFLLSHLELWQSLMMVSSIFFFVTRKMHLSSFGTSSDSNVWIGFLLLKIFRACNKCCSILTSANNHKYYSILSMWANANQTTVLDFKRVAMHWSLPVIVHSAAYECTIQWSWSWDKCLVTEVSSPSNQFHNLLATKLFVFFFSVLWSSPIKKDSAKFGYKQEIKIQKL